MQRPVRYPRLLLGVVAIGAVLFFASTYAGRIQVSLSLRFATAVSRQQLKNVVYGPMGYYASLFEGVYYVGSDLSFDYIVIKHGRFAPNAFKTQLGDLSIERRIEISADEKSWVDLAGLFPPPSGGHAEAVSAETPKPHARNCNFSQYHPLRISSDWMWRGGVVKRVEPIYPAEAQRMHVAGKIFVRVLINSNGEVEQACGDGHPLLRNAAENAALQWVFRTPELNGEKLPYIDETLAFKFVLGEPLGRTSH